MTTGHGYLDAVDTFLLDRLLDKEARPVYTLLMSPVALAAFQDQLMTWTREHGGTPKPEDINQYCGIPLICGQPDGAEIVMTYRDGTLEKIL